MKVECITLREIRMQLKSPFETSFGVTQNRRILLVEAIADGVSGWGEVTAVEAPSYNSETTDTAWHIISDFIAPRVVGKDFVSAAQVPQLLDGIRGHHMAKAGVENAFWDVEAQQSGMPLSKLLGGTLTEIACGVSLGIQESPKVLVNKVERELRSGYQRIKLKIKPGKDVDFISAVRNRFPNIVLSVDANSAYRLEDSDHLRTFDDFQLLMIEQPLEWDDINSHAKAQAQIRTAICLDECINHELCFKHSVPVWCGGMLESGIGRAHNIAMSTLPGFTLPGDVSASSRYWNEDIIEPEVEVTPKGTIPVANDPGLGYVIKRDLVERLSVRSRSWRAADQVSV